MSQRYVLIEINQQQQDPTQRKRKTFIKKSTLDKKTEHYIEMGFGQYIAANLHCPYSASSKVAGSQYQISNIIAQ